MVIGQASHDSVHVIVVQGVPELLADFGDGLFVGVDIYSRLGIGLRGGCAGWRQQEYDADREQVTLHGNPRFLPALNGLSVVGVLGGARILSNRCLIFNVTLEVQKLV